MTNQSSSNSASQTLAFSKMHGLGNDFMVVDATKQPFNLSESQIQQLANRHFGIGFDQLLIVEPATRAEVDFKYRIFNADGSEVTQCGNGARCFAKFVRQQNLSDKNPIRVETKNTDIELLIHDETGLVEVDMGYPNFEPEKIPLTNAEQSADYSIQLDDQEVRFFAMSIGNPHAVIVTDSINQAPVARVGHLLSTHSVFPQGANIGFMQIENRNAISLRVFERGTGETLACGTGACAAVASGIRAGLLDSPVTVSLAGGQLQILWEKADQTVTMIGPASHVFDGEINLDNN